MLKSYARTLGRFVMRRYNTSRFLMHQANIGSNVRIGPNVLIRNPQFIRCARDVTISDGAELIAESAIGASAPSIHLGRSVKIGKRCQLAASPGTIEIGDFASLHTGTYLLGNVYVGRYALLSVNIFASSGDHHPFDTPHRLIRDQDSVALARPSQSADAVVIEEDCWIGWGAVIKKGVHIGRGAIVGANAVVTRDVPPYMVVAGQPARPIRERLHFDPPKIIEAAMLAHSPYLYRGFMQSQDERDHFSSRVNNHISALHETILVLAAAQSTTFSLRLRGTTLVENVNLWANSTHIHLPESSHTAFDVTIILSAGDSPTIDSPKPLPRLSGHQLILIRSLQKGAISPDAQRCEPLWAIHSAAMLD